MATGGVSWVAGVGIGGLGGVVTDAVATDVPLAFPAGLSFSPDGNLLAFCDSVS